MNLEDLGRVTLVAGAPSSGKTEFALGMLVAAMRRYGDGNAVMTVSGRQIADALGDRAIRELSAVSQARPVTTLPAVAFRLLTAVVSSVATPLVLKALFTKQSARYWLRMWSIGNMATIAPPAICCAPISRFPNGQDWWPTIPPTHSPTNCATCSHA